MSYNITHFQSKSKHRIAVPKALKDRLWDITFGQDAGQGKCDVCDAIINSKRFEAGHIKAVHHGGSTTLDNLKCICSTCNKSMGTRNLEEFKQTYFPAISKKIKKQHNKCECCCHNVLKLISTNNATSQIIHEKIDNQVVEFNSYNNDNDDDNDDDDDEKIRKQKLNIKLNELFSKFVYIPSI